MTYFDVHIETLFEKIFFQNVLKGPFRPLCGVALGNTYISKVVIGIFVANIPAYGINTVTSTGHICTCKFCRSSNLYNSIRVIYSDSISNVKSQSRDQAIFKAK